MSTKTTPYNKTRKAKAMLIHKLKTVSMATWLSLSNIISFILPTPPPPPPPSKAPPFNTISLSSRKPKNNTLSVSSQEDQSSSLSPELSSVICPSLAYANTLFFNSAYNVQVIVDDNEPEERLLNRFRREVMRAGVIQECKRRRYFENKQDEKKRRTRDAAKRNKRRRSGGRFTPPGKEEVSSKKKDDDDEDNWDMPDGDLPN